MTLSAQDIFEQICDLDATERLESLSRLCDGDAQLLAEIESLLRAHDDAGEFLNEPTIGPSDSDLAIAGGTVPISEGPGSVVDRYKLLEKIGEGGFGVVYMAQQHEPIRRRVALKIIKLGMDTKQVVARFEAERQALAMMDHANIARVIDGGSTETGRPYFVMELVRGDPITQYCDQKRLPLRQRLELFQQVCRAIEHAHQKGIIHRDIKPSNVLVTIADDKPLVKVIDFGIAKATSAELTEKTLFTEFRQLVGTPLYMSPEQAEKSGVDVDTRTDVYALGVMLYEMLTGRTPLDPKKLNSAAWGELQRMIVEDEPTKPSLMISSSIDEMADVAKHRATDPSQLGTLLRGDLDWIVLKAIEKDRSRRYGTASQFAADIQRFLDDEPVEATPPSSTYRLRKFARRNRALLATVAAVFAALVVGLISTSTAAAWAVREQRSAEAARARAEQQERSARRAATIAGATVMLSESDASNLADAWKTEIAEKQSQLGVDNADVAKLETQYTTWYANWLFQNGRPGEACKLIDHCYDRARELVGLEDPAFLALCNVRVQALQTIDTDRAKIASTYDDLMIVLKNVLGQQQHATLLPQYAGALAEAGRNQDAANAVQQLLSYLRTHRLPSEQLNSRIDVAHDQLMTWGQEYPELLRQLESVRQSGMATAAEPTVENDEELAKDLAALQGHWENRRVEGGRFVDHMIQKFDGQDFATQWVDEHGEPIRGRSGRMELTRSGGAKVMKSFLGGSNAAGLAFIYHLKDDKLTIVSGMLTNEASLPQIELRTFRKLKQDAAEQQN